MDCFGVECVSPRLFGIYFESVLPEMFFFSVGKQLSVKAIAFAGSSEQFVELIWH